ncbi:MAG: DUF5320 domain-containing protein [Thermodesulforhabdaceae bacterium]
MPGGDRTGPWGAGPRTGRAAGFCAGFGMPGYANPIPGRGSARWYGWRGGPGGGWGRGFRHRRWWCWWAPWRFFGWGGSGSAEEEKAFLQNELKSLNEEMEAIRKRLEELEKSSE